MRWMGINGQRVQYGWEMEEGRRMDGYRIRDGWIGDKRLTVKKTEKASKHGRSAALACSAGTSQLNPIAVFCS